MTNNTNDIIKKKTGRPPTTTKDIFPNNWKDIIYSLASQGASDVEIKAHFMTLNGMTARAIDLMWWAMQKREIEFADVIKKSRILCQSWWEKQAKKYMYHPKDSVFESAIWFMNMKNRFAWKDKTEVDHGLSDNFIDKFKDMTTLQLKEKLNEFIGKDRK